MNTPNLRSVVEHALSDADFRAQLLADPAGVEGLIGEQIKVLLAEVGRLEGPLTDEMLDEVAGGPMICRARPTLC